MAKIVITEPSQAEETIKPFQTGGEVGTEPQGWDAAIDELSKPETVKKLQATFGSDDIARQIRNLETFSRAQKTKQLNAIALANQQRSENEIATYKEYNSGTLTTEGVDAKLEADEIGVNVHAIYKGLLEEKALKNTDAILAEKWLNDTLTLDDIKTAQAQGRLTDSNTIGAWMARLDKGQTFNTGAYDQALTRIREVRTDKTKYDDVRLWLLENAKELGFQWDETRNKLETAMNATVKAEDTPHINRAHKLVDQYAKDNPRINDGTLGSIRRIQTIHDAIDAREDFTPVQMRDLTQALLMPFEEEEAKGWIQDVFGAVTKFGMLSIIIRGTKKVRAERQKILNSMMLIQPISKDEFKQKFNNLEVLFGVDSKESDLYYEKYVDGFSEPPE